jgi:hypothetical protein
MSACEAVMKWGGSRSLNKGAPLFLTGKGKLLQKYLIESQKNLSLKNSGLNDILGIDEMNSMLSKVHSLAANDGLPIYDSRVAGSIGALVEIYRQTQKNSWNKVPEELCFKATERDLRRRVHGIINKRLAVIDPGVMTRGTDPRSKALRAKEWSSNMIRLGWIIESLLEKLNSKGTNPFPAESSKVDKMHAMEASLFMIGYNVKCILQSIE